MQASELETIKKSTHLKNDIDLLGNILGKVIRQQAGKKAYQLVEKIRSHALHSRMENHNSALEDVNKVIKTLSPSQSIIIAKSFGHFLNLVNIAEGLYGIDVETSSKSVHEMIAKCIANQGSHATSELINNLSIHLVLTAHPTEVKRRTQINKYRKISNLLQKRKITEDDYTREDIDQKLHALVTNIWLTDEIREKRPTPIEEARWGCAVIEENIWDSIPAYFRQLNSALNANKLEKISFNQKPITLGSWMGGDRDGNPYVTAQVTEEVVMIYRWQCLKMLIRDVDHLSQELSINAANEQVRYLGNYAREPYRYILKQLLDKLKFTQNSYTDAIHKKQFVLPEGCIKDPEEILSPLRKMHQSLIDVGADAIAYDDLSGLIRKVQVFGINLVKLDIRQEANRHLDVISRIYWYLGLGNYHQLEEREKINWLVSELKNKRPILPPDCPFNEEEQEVINTFKTIAKLPSDQFGAYVISMTSYPSDILHVALLQKACFVEKHLPIVPLFETLDDLKQSSHTLKQLFAIDWYRAYCNYNQEVMIGYSDSAKDAGKLAASWHLYKAQQEICEIANAYGINICFFHGRGGSIGRGGGPIEAALLSQPPHTLQGSIKITEQGEVIHQKFGTTQLALKSLILYTNSVLQASLMPPPKPKQSWIDFMERHSDASMKAYKEVLNENPHFMSYLSQATPANELGRFYIGSRPSSRKMGLDLASLRAIPWIFAWNQTRLLLPCWLGIDVTFYDLSQEDQAILKEMAKEWPFFKNLIDLLNMTLFKSDLDISKFYDQKLPSHLHELGNKLREKLNTMYDINEMLQAFYHESNGYKSETTMTNLEYRTPYIDPLNLVQAHVMHEMKNVNSDTKQYQLYLDALMLSIAGIAAGIKNTG